MSVQVLGCHMFLIQGDHEGFEVLKGFRVLSDKVALDLIPKAIVEGGSDDILIAKLCFQHELFKELSIAVNGPSLLESSKELLLGLLFGIQISPFESEVFLEEVPGQQVGWSKILVLHKLQLNALPVGCLVSAQLEGPLDLNMMGQELVSVEVNIVVALCKESPCLGSSAIKWCWECNLKAALGCQGQVGGHVGSSGLLDLVIENPNVRKVGD